jgi:hypothetical protein
MDRQFVAARALQEIEFQVSLLRVMSPGDLPAPQVDALADLLDNCPHALVPKID